MYLFRVCVDYSTLFIQSKVFQFWYNLNDICVLSNSYFVRSSAVVYLGWAAITMKDLSL
jgi:hypothetical protein